MTYRRLGNTDIAADISRVPIAVFTYKRVWRDVEIEAGDKGHKIFGAGAVAVAVQGIRYMGEGKRWKAVLAPSNLVGGDCVWAEEFVEPGADGSVTLVDVESTYKSLRGTRNLIFNVYNGVRDIPRRYRLEHWLTHAG